MKGSIAVYHVHMIREGAIPSEELHLQKTLILGNRDDIEEMSNSSSVVLTTVLKLLDKYDMYGQVAYPKHHKQLDVPDIYLLAAKTKTELTDLWRDFKERGVGWQPEPQN